MVSFKLTYYSENEIQNHLRVPLLYNFSRLFTYSINKGEKRKKIRIKWTKTFNQQWTLKLWKDEQIFRYMLDLMKVQMIPSFEQLRRWRRKSRQKKNEGEKRKSKWKKWSLKRKSFVHSLWKRTIESTMKSEVSFVRDEHEYS